MKKLLNRIIEENDRDHKEIKSSLDDIKISIAPKVAANERAIKIILSLLLIIIAGAGLAKAFVLH